MKPGDCIVGKYKIIREIGRGGMSVVWLAEDLTLHSFWAVKEVLRSEAPAAQWKERQIRSEAMLLKRLSHPGIPRIVELFTGTDHLLVVMDYVDGETLEEWIRKFGRPGGQRVLEWARQLCDILIYLHGQSPPLLYRDLKPANIIRRSNGRLCLIDFGIAAEFAVTQECKHDMNCYKLQNFLKLPRAGTRGYAAPEQLATGICDERSDLYALGKTMQFLLEGSLEEGKPGAGVPAARNHRNGNIREIIRICTQPDPGKRYQSASELMKDLLKPDLPEIRQRRNELRKRVVFGVLILLTLAFCTWTIFQRAIRQFAREEAYSEKLKSDALASAEQREQAYLDAMELRPEDSSAFMQLLDLYESEGGFGDRESDILTARLQQNRSALSREEDLWSSILHRIGCLYLFRFQGGDGSAREQILRAEPWFSEWMSCTGRPDGMFTFCSFYKAYAAANGGSAREEPDPSELQACPEAVREVLEQTEQYQGTDRAFANLRIYRELVNFLYEWRYAFRKAGVSVEALQTIFEEITDLTNRTDALRADTLQLKEEILKDCAMCSEEVRELYEELSVTESK